MIINKDRFYVIVGILISLTVFAVNSYPIFEGDLFWHMKTGEWILHNRSLPLRDPFSYTTYLLGGEQDPVRVKMMLSSYWLGQVILSLLWEIGGSTAIVLTRAFSYAAIIMALCMWIGKSSRGFLAVAGLLAVGAGLINFPGERPQLFGYLLFLVMLMLIERARLQERVSACSWLIPAIMCIWANIHGSFLLGDVVIFLYVMSYLVKNFRKPDSKSGYLLLLTVSVGASAVNPNYLNLFGAFFKHYDLGFSSSIMEYASPLKYYQTYLSYLAIAASVLLLLLAKWKIIALEHVLLLGFLVSISLYNVRYIPFLFLSIPVAYMYVSSNAVTSMQRSAILVMLFLWGVTRPWQGAFAFGVNPMYPESSVRFLNEAAPSGPLFNFIDWGGYIMYFSKYSVFSDGRYIAPRVRGYHDDILLKPYGMMVLDRFNISTVLIPGTNPFVFDKDHGQPLQLLLSLSQDNRWVLVHYDNVAVVFVRDIPENSHVIQRYRIPKDMVMKHVELRQKSLTQRGM